MDIEEKVSMLDVRGRLKLASFIVVGLGVEERLSDVGSKLGYSSGSAFSQVINGNVPVARNLPERFTDAYPFMSRTWLESGRGGLFGAGAPREERNVDHKALAEAYKAELEDNKRRLDDVLRILASFAPKAS